MRKFLIFLTLNIVYLFTAIAVYAHPPVKIDLTFAPATETLTAVISHPVSNPEVHYIEKVEIKKNNQVIAKQEYAKQDNHQTQIASIQIPDAKKGDVLTLQAFCSISGSLKKKLAVQ